MFYLEKIIEADLIQAETDDRKDRCVMGAVVALRVLLQAHPEFGFLSHAEDVAGWKARYLEWFDTNAKRLQRTKADRDRMRELAVLEFDALLELCQGTGYSFRESLEMADDTTADLRYFGDDGHLVKIPPLL